MLVRFTTSRIRSKAQNGLADLGWVGTLWEPIKMPLMNVSFYARS